jgi:hypothetical protein
LTSSPDHAAGRLVGMIRSPRATLARAIAVPRSFAVGALIIAISAACSAGFLMTRVGRLAALDQQVRQLESFGAVVDDDRYETLRGLLPYRPAISAAAIVVGWPCGWLLLAAIVQRLGAAWRRVPIAQVVAVFVHASAVFALRSMVATPINVMRESLGGATSLGMIVPAFGDATFPARLLGAVDVFAVWWLVLVAMGLGMLYQARSLPIARWLFGAYAAGAAALALTQSLGGGL